MAFTNVQSASIGGAIKITVADFTATEAGATQTIGVGAGRVWACLATSQDASGALGVPNPVRYSVSLSGSVTTVTVYPSEGITAGVITIIHS